MNKQTAIPRGVPFDSKAFSAVSGICRRENPSLFFASFFLPLPKRYAVRAISAFGRLMEQAIVQGGCDDDSIQQRLDLFSDRLDEIYAGRFELPAATQRDETQHVLAALTDAVLQFEIPRQYFIDWAEGLRHEQTVSRYATWASLEKYLEHRGGAPALVLASILGMQTSEGATYSTAMGKAICITRILEQLGKDRRRGRIILPLQDLARFGYTERELAAETVNAAFLELMKFEIARARELYRRGAEGICWLADDGSRAAAAVIAVSAAAHLSEIQRSAYRSFGEPYKASLLQTVWHLRSAWKLARRGREEPLPPVF